MRLDELYLGRGGSEKDLPKIEKPLKNNAISIILGLSKEWLDPIHRGVAGV